MAKKGKRTAKGRKSSTRYVSPGVYLEEVSSGSRPLEGVGTAIAAFVGFGGGEGSSGTPWRRAGTLILLVTGAAAGVWAWRQRAAGRLGP